MQNTVIIGPNTYEKTVKAGRPRMSLLVGQQCFIERAYIVLGLSQAHIAQEVGVAIPRVRRYLVDRGLYTPRPSSRPAKRESQLDEAVKAYQNDVKVTMICQTYEVNPAELYRELRRHNVPFRTKPQVFEHRPPQYTPVEAVM